MHRRCPLFGGAFTWENLQVTVGRSTQLLPICSPTIPAADRDQFPGLVAFCAGRVRTNFATAATSGRRQRLSSVLYAINRWIGGVRYRATMRHRLALPPR